MATVSDITYGNFDPVLYTPDYSFLRYSLDKKTSQYEQGLQSVSSAYNALKKDVTDPTNGQRRDEYLKSANAQLQKLASSDLSLQENVNAANSVFQPMATDKAFLYDSYHTENNRNQLAKMKSWAESDDPETRKKFNQDIYDWVASDLDSLKTANGDVSKYKVQGRGAVAYTNAQDVINKTIKDNGFEWKTEADGGAYVIGQKDGAAFRQSYKEFANAVLDADPNYQRQLSILGDHGKDKIIKQFKQDNPYAATMTDQAILAQHADTEFSKYRDQTKKNLESYSTEFQKQKGEFLAWANTNSAALNDPNNPENGRLKAEFNQKAQALEAGKAQIGTLNSNFEKEYGDNTTMGSKKAEWVSNFASNPVGSIANMYKMSDVNKFANIRSAQGSHTLKENQAYFAALTAKNNALNIAGTLANNERKTDIAQEGQDLKEETQAFKEGKTGIDAYGNAVGSTGTASKSGKVPEIQYAGISATQITTTEALTSLSNKISNSYGTALANLINPNGALTVLETMGVQPQEVGILRGYFKKSFDGTSVAKPTTEESAALSKAYNIMYQFAKQNGKLDALKELDKDANKPVTSLNWEHILDIAISNINFTDPKQVNAAVAWKDHKEALAEGQDLSKQLVTAKNIIVNSLKDNKDFAGMFIKGEDGNNDIVGKETILKNLKKYTNLTETEKEDIATKYANGTLDYEYTMPAAQINYMNTKPGHIIIKTGGKKLSFVQGTDLFPVDPLLYKKLNNRINSEIPIPLGANMSNEKVQGSSTFLIQGNMKDNLLGLLNSPTQDNANIFVSSDGSDKLEQVDPEDQNKIRSVLTSKAGSPDLGVKAILKSSIDGKLAFAITLKEGNKQEVKNTDIYGKTYYFPININNRSPEALQLINNLYSEDQFTKYKNTGKPYDVNTFEGMGVSATIMPSYAGANDGTVYIKQKKYDPMTRTYSNDFITSSVTYDLNKTTFNEIKSNLYSKVVMPYVMQRMQYTQQQQQNTTNTGASTAATLERIKNL